MKLIVGLGNPGIKYGHTRHNLGFMVLDRFLKDFSQVQKTIWEDNKKLKCDMAKIDWSLSDAQDKHGKRVEKVILAKPKTYMNNSGLAVSLVASYWQVATSDIWILHDDVDLPLGSMKIRFGGASAGHKGVMSIIKSLNTDKFWRFRFGIGNPKKSQNSKFKIQKDVDNFVLSIFTQSEAGKARELIKKGARAIGEALENGLEKAMNRFNTK